jgi:hypothetical protein
MQVEDILSEVSQARKDKGLMFSLICVRQSNANSSIMKTGTLRGGHTREREVKEGR